MYYNLFGKVELLLDGKLIMMNKLLLVFRPKWLLGTIIWKNCQGWLFGMIVWNNHLYLYLWTMIWNNYFEWLSQIDIHNDNPEQFFQLSLQMYYLEELSRRMIRNNSLKWLLGIMLKSSWVLFQIVLKSSWELLIALKNHLKVFFQGIISNIS